MCARSWSVTGMPTVGKRAWPASLVQRVRASAPGEDAAMETIYRLSGTTEVAFESEPCAECCDDEAHTLDRAMLETPYPIYDVAVIPRSEDADDDRLHLAFFGNEVFY